MIEAMYDAREAGGMDGLQTIDAAMAHRMVLFALSTWAGTGIYCKV